MIKKNIKENTNLSDLKCKMNIQNLLTSISIFVAAIIEKKNKKTDLSKWRESQKRILKKKIEKKIKLVIFKIIRFSTFRDIKNENDNIDIVDHMPALNGKTKSPEVILEGKNNIIIIEKEPSKKR
jgi:hypothetical protein